jgi:lipopolysaccharide export system protein LptA
MKGQLTNKVLLAVHRGNVRVNHPRWWTRSEVMTYQIPVAGRRIESLVLESNVFIFSLDEKGRTNNAHGDTADYTHKVSDGRTNEIMVLNGSPAVVKTPDFTITSGRIVCDLINGTFDGGTNYKMTINAEGLSGATNGPGLDLFKRPTGK